VTWVPQECTLSTAEQPLRVAEFDDLFAAVVRPPRRLAPERLELVLAPDVEAAARDLVARESRCCSFFAFTVRSSPDETVVEVDVPAAQTGSSDGRRGSSRSRAPGEQRVNGRPGRGRFRSLGQALPEADRPGDETRPRPHKVFP
jgi:hypothetical protein